MNKAASTLGKLARGKKKSYSPQELAKRTQRLIQARAAKALKRANAVPVASRTLFLTRDGIKVADPCPKCGKQAVQPVSSTGLHCSYCGHDWRV